MEDLEAQLADYSDPTSGNGDRLMTEADNVLSGLAVYPSPGADAYEAWLEDSSYTVDGVVVADDGDTATATATVTHAPLIEFVENHEGLADDPGEPQETTLELTYVRDGSSWTADGDELEEAVFTAYLPSDEELIISDVDSYFEADDDMRSGFIAGLESGSGGELDQLGISADEFADAYLDGLRLRSGHGDGRWRHRRGRGDGHDQVVCRDHEHISRVTSMHGRSRSTPRQSRARTRCIRRPARCLWRQRRRQNRKRTMPRSHSRRTAVAYGGWIPARNTSS